MYVWENVRYRCVGGQPLEWEFGCVCRVHVLLIGYLHFDGCSSWFYIMEWGRWGKVMASAT